MKYTIYFIFCWTVFGLSSCKEASPEPSLRSFFRIDETGIKTGVVKIIPIETPKGKFNIWTKAIGNNPTTRLLLLNGELGMIHEYLECFESFLPAEGIELIYCDQQGCGFSDNLKHISMWHLPRYVDGVGQFIIALNMTNNNFNLLGHSWGSILCMEYALKFKETWMTELIHFLKSKK